MERNGNGIPKNGTAGRKPRSIEEPKHLTLGQSCHYKEELRRLHIELVKLQEWVRHKG